MTGVLHLIGVGPGDPELMTLKAVRILQEVDCVAFPQKPGQVSMALDIARGHIPDGTHLMPIDIPMQLERQPAQGAYDMAANGIAALTSQGKSVAYLCEGDPLFYGSAMYLVNRLRTQTRIQVVPGITSLTAGAAAIAQPLAARNERLKVLPAPLDSDTLRAELITSEGVAIIKVGRHFDRIKTLLVETGHHGATIIEHATGSAQRISALEDFNTGEQPYFSIILSYRGAEAWGT